jgi:acetylornithine deacetylase
LLEELYGLTGRINARAKEHPIFKGMNNPVKFNPGVIRGGDWGSSTPAWCEVDCRIGLLEGTTLAQARQEVLDTVAAAAKGDSFLANNPPEVIWNGFQADAFHLPEGSEAERVLAATHEAVYGEKLKTHVSTGVADVRAYLNYYGIPALCYGPKGEGAHAFDERAHLPSLKKNTLSVATFIAEWCGVRSI